VAVTNAYCAVQDVRDFLGDGASTLSTSVLERAINAASRQVDQQCFRRFWRDAAVTTRVYRATDSRAVWTDDISTTTGLVVATDPGGDGTYETAWTLNTDYRPEPLSADQVAAGDTVTPYAFWRLAAVGTRLMWPTSTVGFPAVQVTARYGWSAVPDDVAMATILRTVGLFRRKDAPFGIAGFGELGGMRIARQDPDVAGLLGPYVKTRPRTLSYDTQRESLFHGRRWSGR
jgi:hypothetical protein